MLLVLTLDLLHLISLYILYDSLVTGNAFATTPDRLTSSKTLHYIGFSEGKANGTWNHRSHWPSTGPRRKIDGNTGGLEVTFPDFIVDGLDSYDDVWDIRTGRYHG